MVGSDDLKKIDCRFLARGESAFGGESYPGSLEVFDDKGVSRRSRKDAMLFLSNIKPATRFILSEVEGVAGLWKSWFNEIKYA